MNCTAIRIAVAVVMSTLLLLSVGCGGKKPPEWTIQGGAAFPKEKGKALYGVGRAPISVNPVVKYKEADMQARGDLAKTLETYIAELSKSFQQETKDFQNPDQTESVALFSDIEKEVTSTTVQGVQIVDHFENKEEGIMYALAKLAMDEVLNTYKSKAKDLAARRKAAFIEGKAEDAVKALDEAIEKKQKALAAEQ